MRALNAVALASLVFAGASCTLGNDDEPPPAHSEPEDRSTRSALDQQLSNKLGAADHVRVKLGTDTFTLGADDKLTSLAGAISEPLSLPPGPPPSCSSPTTITFFKGANEIASVDVEGCELIRLASGAVYQVNVDPKVLDDVFFAPRVMKDVVYGTVTKVISFPDGAVLEGGDAEELDTNLDAVLSKDETCPAASGAPDGKREYYAGDVKLATVELHRACPVPPSTTSSGTPSGTVVRARLLGPDGQPVGFFAYDTAGL